MKRLILCCDGTWNSADQERNGTPCPTNVVKLGYRVAKRDDEAYPLKPDPVGKLHNSKIGLYRLTAGIDRAIGADPTQSVHPSVRTRWDADPGYRPASLKTVVAA